MNSSQDHTSGTKKRALIATMAIMGSRVLGLVREQVFAFFFGAGAILDAFYVAFRIPNLLRDLAAEGALSQSFISVFSKQIIKGEKQESQQLINKMTAFIFVVMGTMTILGMIFAPQITKFIASGFSGEKLALTVTLMRILFPFVFFISQAVLLMGILNSNKVFFIPFSASTFCNFIAISLGLLFAYLFSPDYIGSSIHKIFYGTALTGTDYLSITNAIMGMALGTMIGGFGQYIFQLPAVFKLGYKIKFDFKFKDSKLIEVLKLTGPAVIAGAAVQVNVLINTEFASLLADGSISYLSFAFRFMQFPLGIFGVSIAAASAPVLAQMVAQNRFDDFRESIQSAIKMSLFLTIPSMVGLIVLGKPIIALVYEHGHFSATDTLQTAYALMAYSFGICFYALIKIYQPAFLSFNNAKTPMRISLFSILVNLIINSYFIFVLHLSHWALAAGTAIVAMTNLILLMIYFRKNIDKIWDQTLVVQVLKIILAAILMGIFVYLINPQIEKIFLEKNLMNKMILVFLPLCLATPLYFALSYSLGIKDAELFLNKIKRKIRR